jgi:hypothetical protein
VIHKKKRPSLDEAQAELAAAKAKQRVATEHTADVAKVVAETQHHQRHLRGDGFYDLFRRGLRGA